MLDELRESHGTQFRAESAVDRAAVHHLDSKLEQISSGEDFDSDEEEGGFTQIGLEMDLDVRKLLGP